MHRLLVLTLLLCVPGAFAQAHRDPQGRYTLQVPKGWTTTQMNNDAVQFSSGSAFVTLLALPSTDPDAMVNAIGTSTGKQWKNFAEARRGDANFGGHPGKYVTYSGTSTMGSDSYLQLLATTDGSLTYLLMIMAPKADFTRQKAAFDQIEQSFTLTAAAVPSTTPPPAPAGAVDRRPAAVVPPVWPSPSSPASTAPPAAPPVSQPGPIATAFAKALGTNVPGENVYRMKMVKIVDERSFEQPMTALSLLIPVDWQFQGQVQYQQAMGCHYNLVKLVFRASSPDGRLGVELFPGNVWQWNDDPNMRKLMQGVNQQMASAGRRGCDIAAPASADQYLRQAVLPAVRRDARVVASEPMPDAVQRMQEEVREVQQQSAAQGIRVNIRTDASRVRVTETVGGTPMEEWFTAMTMSMGMPAPSFNMFTGRVGQSLNYINGADHVFAVRAPQGQLDAQEKFFQLIMGSVQTNPQWEARVQATIATLAAQDSKGAMDRSAIATKAAEDQRRITRETYENTNKSREHSMAAWSQYMRGVQTYRNPSTGEMVELSNRYDHAWAGSDGTYIVTDSSTLNPNSSMQGSWTRLEQVKR